AIAKEQALSSSVERELTILNYPNPFNPTTKIKYSIPETGLVVLKVYDMLGREIVTLVNEKQPFGHHEVGFDGSRLPSGIYFYTINYNKQLLTGKMILVK
ncbi:MAG: T9SS type A sorting domain-containing protein, partial [Bacteroidota bacterium]